MRLLACGLILGAVLFGGEIMLASALPQTHGLRDETMLLILLALGALIYVVLVMVLLGRAWLKGLMRDTGAPASPLNPAALD